MIQRIVGALAGAIAGAIVATYILLFHLGFSQWRWVNSYQRIRLYDEWAIIPLAVAGAIVGAYLGLLAAQFLDVSRRRHHG